MEDVKKTTASETPAGETATPQPQGANQATEVAPQGAGTVDVSEPEKPVVEKTIPYTRFKEVNDSYRKLQRELAQERASRQNSQYDPNDLETLYAHPAYQELALKTAEYELKDGVGEILDRYPQLPKDVAKAIKSNPRGFVQPGTDNVPMALMDIESWVENSAQALETPQTAPQPLKVAATNAGPASKGLNPAEIGKILAKPPMDWTDKEVETLEQYKAGLK